MDYRKLIEEALEARKFSYAPYSRFCVGAALLGKSGTVYRGCNVESCSYGPTNCAERTAVFKAVSEGEREFAAIAIAGGPEGEEIPLKHTAFPCGVCRQVLAEFCTMDLPVIVARSTEDYDVYTLGDLLPHAFTPLSLPEPFHLVESIALLSGRLKQIADFVFRNPESVNFLLQE